MNAVYLIILFLRYFISLFFKNAPFACHGGLAVVFPKKVKKKKYKKEKFLWHFIADFSFQACFKYYY